MDHTSCRLRLAAIADAPAILEIYAQYMDTPITFETELPSLEEFEGRIRAITAEYPWIVCEDETGRIIGYAYGHKQLERPSSGIRIRYASHRSSHSDLSPDCRLCGRPVPLKALKAPEASVCRCPSTSPDCPDIQKVPHSNGTPRAQAAYAHMHSQ